MNIESNILSKSGSPANIHLLNMGLDGLRPFQDKRDGLLDALETLEEFGDETAARNAAKLRNQLCALEASVTMIGQVKAGKTSLVNAMTGWPDLLPADVNPWTSVVTSIHMNPDAYQEGNHSSFQFFDKAEWDRLMDRGGRVGELAGRAGAEDEVEKVRNQIAEMREKSRRRLGNKFELLLGEKHNYGYFDNDLIERYVCLGDDFDDEPALKTDQGRFADITKSADLYMQRAEVPIPLCIRDTPGVNDTFMMREQITIRAIRESRICVVVLSAHQALSSVDMALIRMISNVKSREVIIFVNRIDELPDPTSQVPEIRASIQRTLKSHHGPEDAQIIFGSAHWANCAISGELDAMGDASSEAMINWAEGELCVDTGLLTVEEMVWELSGVPELYHAIAERVEEGVGEEVLNRIARRAKNLANGVRAKAEIVLSGSAGKCHLTYDEMETRLTDIGNAATKAFDAALQHHMEDFHRRLERSHKNFLDRATAALVTHLETYGDEAVWSYDPTGLRILLRSSYQVFGKNVQSAGQTVLNEVARSVADMLAEATGTDKSEFELELPKPPRIPPPVLLGQTIALDLKSNWWSRWWQRRRGYRAYAMEFADMIRAETDPIVSGLKAMLSNAVREENAAMLDEFLKDQHAIIQTLAGPESAEDDGHSPSDDRRAALDQSMIALERFAA